MQRLSEYFCDVFIIGSGAAGLSLALQLAPYCRVLLASKGSLREATTYYAQGGIAAVSDETDSWQAHHQDTLTAGAGICDPEVVQFVTQQAHRAINWLMAQGMPFDRKDSFSSNPFHLTQEGGHSHRRILHVADTTGRSLIETLIKQTHLHQQLQIIEHSQVIKLLTQPHLLPKHSTQIVGALLWQANQQQLAHVTAKIVVLATGGAAGLYSHNTQMAGHSQGDGIALAWQAGCSVANLEFTQFHPTTLYHSTAPNFLLTEALRGEGAWLCRPDGSRFMLDVDSHVELAPRDIVARAMHQEMKRLATPCLYLDIRHQPALLIQQRFPALYQRLSALGLDLTQQPIPVVPAAHYTCGGVVVDHSGRTDIAGLYAIGEVSYTGLHGANRLASNALLECIVYACSTAKAIRCQLAQLSASKPSLITNFPSMIDQPLATHWIERQQALQQLLWNQVGLIRSHSDLEQALEAIQTLKADLDQARQAPPLSIPLLNLYQQCQVAHLIVRCALQRQESRGCHYLIEHLKPLSSSAKPTILSPQQFSDP
ncbi:MAG: L-aspartate oxidase [Candidatus Symbiodolus clandestinus]